MSRTMTVRMRRCYGAVLSALLALLGFASCHHHHDAEEAAEEGWRSADSAEIRLMYGVEPVYRH